MTDMEIEMLEYLWEAWMHHSTSANNIYHMDTFFLLADLLAEYLHEEYQLP
jgi:hypothetical protein